MHYLFFLSSILVSEEATPLKQQCHLLDNWQVEGHRPTESKGFWLEGWGIVG